MIPNVHFLGILFSMYSVFKYKAEQVYSDFIIIINKFPFSSSFQSRNKFEIE